MDNDWLSNAYLQAASVSDPEIRRFLLDALAQSAGPSVSLDDVRGFGSLLVSNVPGTSIVSVAGAEDFYGMKGIFVKNSSLSDSQVFGRFVAHAYLGRFRKLSKFEAGFGLQLEREGGKRLTFRVFDLSKFDQAGFRSVAPSAYLNAPKDARKFVISQYAKRLPLSSDQLVKLEAISSAVEKRSILFAVTNEPFVDFSGDQFTILHDRKPERWPNSQRGWLVDRPRHQERHPAIDGFRKDGTRSPFEWVLWSKSADHFEIQGTATAVYSRSPDELLPLELYNDGFRVSRSPGEVIVEMGRYSITASEVKALSPKLLQQLASVIAADPTVSRIVIEADPAHARLFKSLGFEIVHEFLDSSGIPRDYVLAVTPDQMTKNLIRMNYDSEIMREWR